MKKLVSAIIFLIMLVASVSFASAVSLKKYYPQEVEYNNPIEILSAGCEWENDHFNACAYVRWFDDVGDYAKVQISGGQPLANSPKQKAGLFTYCQDVGISEGTQAIDAYLLSLSGSFKESDSAKIQCRKSKLTSVKYEKNLTFRVQSINSRAKSSGTFHVTGIPGTPVSCDFAGTWITDNRVVTAGTRMYCDKASGKFTGHADLSEQYSTEDPGPFNWRQQGIFDPPPHTDQNYFFSAVTCDPIRYDEGKNYVRAYVSNFEQGGLWIDWDYNNADTQPAVDVLFTVKCDAIPENAQEVSAEEQKEGSSSDFFNEPEVTPEAQKPKEGSAPAITIETPKPTIWNIISGWFRKVFLK